MDRREFVLGSATLGGASVLLASAAAGAAPLATANGGGSAAAVAFSALLQELAAVQAEYLSPRYGITRVEDLAEGQRLLLHLLNTALDFWLEADPERPVWTAYQAPTRKLLGDNPDALYYFTPVRGDRGYRIRGNLAGATFTSFTVEGGSAAGAAAGRSTAALDDTGMDVAVDGSFEIIASVTRPANGNWLPLAADSGQITTRHYFESRDYVANRRGFEIPLTIEPLDPVPPAKAPDDAEIARRIGDVARFVRAMMHLTLGSAASAEARPAWFSTVPNSFTPPQRWSSETGYGNLHAHYCAAPFVLMPDDALLIEGELPPCRFANVVLWNRYMQSFDYTRRRVSLNRAQMTLGDGGSYRIVVAHRDPGLPNWLDTEGRASGLMYWRFLLATADVPTPRARVVKFADLT